MLRNRVKLAKAKNHNAQIEQGRINIDGKLYLPDMFDTLPVGLRVSNPSHKTTVNGGIAFASEWSPLSNMHRTDILYKKLCTIVLSSATRTKKLYLKRMRMRLMLF